MSIPTINNTSLHHTDIYIDSPYMCKNCEKMYLFIAFPLREIRPSAALPFQAKEMLVGFYLCFTSLSAREHWCCTNLTVWMVHPLRDQEHHVSDQFSYILF